MNILRKFQGDSKKFSRRLKEVSKKTPTIFQEGSEKSSRKLRKVFKETRRSFQEDFDMFSRRLKEVTWRSKKFLKRFREALRLRLLKSIKFIKLTYNGFFLTINHAAATKPKIMKHAKMANSIE